MFRGVKSSSFLLKSSTFNISEFEPEQWVTLDLDPAADEGIIPLTLTQQGSGSLRMHCVSEKTCTRAFAAEQRRPLTLLQPRLQS